MDEIIEKLSTPKECTQLAKNVADSRPELAKKARRRGIELKALTHGNKSPVEMELLKAVYAYEEVLSEKNKRATRASRTWQMIKRHGITGAAERAVNRKIEPMGYKMLAEMGMHDLTFEAVIVRYPEAFSKEVIERAEERLVEFKKYGPGVNIEPIAKDKSQLKDISCLLATKKPFMVSFMGSYIFSRIKVPRQETLSSSANFMKMIDFCLRTRQRIKEKDFKLANAYFTDNFKAVKQCLIDGNWQEVKHLIYDAHGVGQKIGSLILEVLIHYGEANKVLEPKLFVPIDTHVQRILSECLRLPNVPSIGASVWASDYNVFQEFLTDNSAEGAPRICFDYLWFVGKVFCQKINAIDGGYSRGYRLCPICWIKDYCTHTDKWFTGYTTD